MKLLYAFWFAVTAVVFGLIGFTDFGAYAITIARWLSVGFGALAIWSIVSSIRKPMVATGQDFDLLTKAERKKAIKQEQKVANSPTAQ
jgi:hypothetical protein